MIVLAVDDEQMALNNLDLKLKLIPEISEVHAFRSPKYALEWLNDNVADLAFLDIDMQYMNGLTLAKEIKEICPGCAIVFLTGHSEYAIDAFEIRATGYLLKPAKLEKIKKEIEYILNPFSTHNIDVKKIYIECFGSFEVFANNVPIRFKYSKTKELLAYLVDRKGAMCEINTLCAVLWEDRAVSLSLKSQLRHLISDLISAFKDAGCQDAVIKQRGSLAIVPSKVKCDYFDWLNGDSVAINNYQGEYMHQYSWAEMTVGTIENNK